MADLVGPAGHVEAFKPQADVFEHLSTRFADRPTVRLVRSAVADRSSVGHVVVPAIAGGIPETALGSRCGCGGGVVATNHAVWRSLARHWRPTWTHWPGGAPPVVGRLVTELIARGSTTWAAPRCVVCGKTASIAVRARCPLPEERASCTNLTDADLLSMALTGHGSSRAAVVDLLEAPGEPLS